MTRSVILGMSGGIDSSAAAIRLKRAGFHILGVFLDLHGHSENGDKERLKTISRQLDIEIRTLVLRDIFARQVLEPFVDEYLAGRTPNPCVICNERVKFMSLMETACTEKADFVATGHYARILRKQKNLFQLCRGLDSNKDQSYVLYRLPYGWLHSLLFPLGNRTKEENISLGKSIFGSLFDEVPESSDLCFLPDGDRSVLTGKGRPGPILDRNGKFIGHHKGLTGYTVGQRKGLGLSGGPWYVLELDLKKNTVIVGGKTDLDVKTIQVGDTVWHESPQTGQIYHAQYRYRSQPAPVRISAMEENSFTVQPLTPIAGVAPGQSLVLYDGDRVVGGGLIKTAERRFV